MGDSLRPFQNESEVLQIGKLTIENRTDRIAIYGNLEVTRDKAGQAFVNALKAVIDATVEALKGEDLPEHITLKTPSATKNPFK